jgi:membrane protein insertase Oxa1/YidC/SpoIIIJ
MILLAVARSTSGGFDILKHVTSGLWRKWFWQTTFFPDVSLNLSRVYVLKTWVLSIIVMVITPRNQKCYH